MVFSSTTFLFAFLPLVLITYFIVPRVLKNAVLLVFSLVFYAWGEPVYVLLMLASITVAYVTGIFADKKRKPGCEKTAFIFMLLAVIWNIGLLLFFKYADFFILNANSLFNTGFKLLGLTLPIGISFYSFQTLSYVIDVYRGEVRSQKNFLNLATYVTLFPQLIAGPIVRYQTIEDQLNYRRESLSQFSRGIKRFAVGLGKKVILANNIGALFAEISAASQSELSVVSSWLGILAYTFQIYFDFSGYSDMAIGLGKMFGFDFLENFNYPYISRSITEFWRRWHISLSTWFRDYVYIPLGGNRRGIARQCLNIMIVWFLTGFWHGANWNFICWGLYFGIILLCEKLFLGKALKKVPAVIQHIYSLLLIIVGWGIFAYEDTSALIQNFKNLFGFGGLEFFNDKAFFWLANYAVTFIALIIASTPLFRKLGEKLTLKAPVLYGCILEPAAAALLLIVSAAYLAGNSFNPFLYFRF
ncbi:MBOAT family O-acyltransferase [Ruminococcus sp. Marseille-P6503]|uniref:MBOAT family O-acyltransferase n=1 Tax=Ruminococcus sp. Marseille-P6503 TaxID=2364796 RepID=UPI000F535C23|nr:MBOAT family O-acyltransferase [Ruminococcus sp. Marseille-P6503]